MISTIPGGDKTVIYAVPGGDKTVIYTIPGGDKTVISTIPGGDKTVISAIPGGDKRMHANFSAFRSCVPQSILILSNTNSCVLCYTLCSLCSCPFYQLEKNELAGSKSRTPVTL